MKRTIFTRRGVHILLLGVGIAAAVAVFFLLAQAGIGLSCPFYRLTGLQCPGCGNSRAALALLRLDVLGALRCNLLFPLEYFYIAWVLLCCCAAYWKDGRFCYSTPCKWLDICVLAAVILWGIVRNFL